MRLILFFMILAVSTWALASETRSGQVTSIVSSTEFVFQTGYPHGYVPVVYSPSTVTPSGAAIAVGQYVSAIGTVDTSGTFHATSVSITSGATVSPTPAPTPSPSSTTSETGLVPGASSIYHYYVSNSGSDYNSGSASSPFRTIQHAVNAAKPSTTIHVFSGIYKENVVVRNSGASSARIVIKSETKWGAQVIGNGGSMLFNISASYVDLVGFDLHGFDTSPYGSYFGVGIYGSHNRVYFNHVHDMTTPSGITSSGCTGISVVWHGQTIPTHLYNEVFNNVVHNMYGPGRVLDGSVPTGTGIYLGDQHNKAYNNLVYTTNRYGIQSNHYTGWNEIRNNTIGNNGTDGIMVAVGGDSTYSITSDYNIVANNIVVNAKHGGISFWQGSPSTLGTHNFLYNNLTYNNGSNINYGDLASYQMPADTGGIHLNPQFVYQAFSLSNSGNFRLQSTSPAINKGYSNSAPGFDLDGNLRPASGAWDIGAYEYGSISGSYFRY